MQRPTTIKAVLAILGQATFRPMLAHDYAMFGGATADTLIDTDHPDHCVLLGPDSVEIYGGTEDGEGWQVAMHLQLEF